MVGCGHTGMVARVWGKIVGAMAGFAMGGPVGAMVGAALGHAAEHGGMGQMPFGGARSALPPARDQVFAMGVVVLAAKLAKCDGPVNRAEIAAFKRCFRIPPESERDVGRLFDQARESAESFLPYATRMGTAFADSPGVLEEVLTALFAIARSDAVLTRSEENFLRQVSAGFGLDVAAWDRARGATAARQGQGGEDPYAVLGVSKDIGADELRATWKGLMRENHPDILAGRGVSEAFKRSAGEKVARINAAWDRIKRERGL